MFRLVFTLMFFFLSNFANAELNGKFRDIYIINYADECFKSQRIEPLNNQISDSTLKSYCSCQATYTANYMNEDQFNELRGIKKDALPDWLTRLGLSGLDYCTKHINEF